MKKLRFTDAEGRPSDALVDFSPDAYRAVLDACREHAKAGTLLPESFGPSVDFGILNVGTESVSPHVRLGWRVGLRMVHRGVAPVDLGWLHLDASVVTRGSILSPDGERLSWPSLSAHHSLVLNGVPQPLPFYVAPGERIAMRLRLRPDHLLPMDLHDICMSAPGIPTWTLVVGWDSMPPYWQVS